MARKLLRDTAASKLARTQEGGAAAARGRPPRKAQRLPKSFRLGVVDLERLQRLSKRLSEEVGRPMRETEIVKGLLLLGERTDAKQLIGAIKDAVFESR
jgi:hypothetical protein